LRTSTSRWKFARSLDQAHFPHHETDCRTR
jgi:hypothetical protein